MGESSTVDGDGLPDCWESMASASTSTVTAPRMLASSRVQVNTNGDGVTLTTESAPAASHKGALLRRDRPQLRRITKPDPKALSRTGTGTPRGDAGRRRARRSQERQGGSRRKRPPITPSAGTAFSNA